MIIEILAVLFTLICVYLTTKNKVSSWPIGIIGLLFYLIVFFNVKLYAEVFLQIIFLYQSFYGWYNWSKFKNKPPAEITNIGFYQIMNLFFLIVFLTGGLNYLLSTHTNASLPLIDSFCASISLTANWLLAKRKIENWFLWAFVDIIYVGMFIYKELYITSILYFVFFFMAIYGYKNWKKERLLAI